MENAEDTAVAAVETLALGVRGYVCEIFDAPETAWRLHQEDHLIQWRNDASLRVDRYDARNLLHDREAFRQRRRTVNGGAENAEEDAELDELRFGDLRRLREDVQRDEKREVEVVVEDRGDPEKQHVEVEEEPFTRPTGWPGGIQVPATRREFDVLCKTAHKTRGNSALEIMMKTRLAGNAQFGFLGETHALHPCYLYMRDQTPHEGSSAARSAVRLLGDEYQESDEEDAERPPAATSSSRGDTVLSPVSSHGTERQRSESRRRCSESRRRRSRSHSRSRSRQRRSRRRRRSRSASTERRRFRDRSRSRSRERRRRSRSASRHRRR